MVFAVFSWFEGYIPLLVSCALTVEGLRLVEKSFAVQGCETLQRCTFALFLRRCFIQLVRNYCADRNLLASSAFSKQTTSQMLLKGAANGEVDFDQPPEAHS
eukprot:6487799-Amphidinium_carterae.2